MGETPLAICEVCGNAMARKGDLLCGDCSRAFTLMLDLLHRHPDIDAADLRRVKEVFEWQTKKTGESLQPEKVRSSPKGQDEMKAPLAIPSHIQRMQHERACDVCAKPLAESDHLLCADCSRASAFVLELVRESAPLVQSRLQAHPGLTGDDLTRILEVFKWRSTKIGPRRPQPKVDVPVSA
jgi:hypothetical protein